MTSSQPLIVGIAGPSGVGKSYFGESIRSSFFIDSPPVKVFTTRKQRPDEAPSGSRVFLSSDEFEAAVLSGGIVLPHRPFRNGNTPLYGFDAQDLGAGHNKLLEVHSSIIASFREMVAARVLVIGLVADNDTLARNIRSRQGDFHDGISASQRLSTAQLEVDEIIEASNLGLVDAVFEYEDASRATAEAAALDIVAGFISGRSQHG